MTKPRAKPKTDLPIASFASSDDWAAWLDDHHETSSGVWLRIAKKSSKSPSVTYAEAIDVALCYGWIDGQKAPGDSDSWLQKFTRRGAKSLWSKINREKVDALIKSRRMKPAGLAAVQQAKTDGRWETAYDSSSRSEIPEDLRAALAKKPKAKAFFDELDRANRYAILFRLQTAKKAETRARRLEEFVAMLGRGEKIHP